MAIESDLKIFISWSGDLADTAGTIAIDLNA
jgi:hypothetical protein